ncbi:uncharacterized protein LOC143344621 [Colletes latitarsis]|uniref:uncharacterized protein LOC143344621 n=1 Tax=Colletes latitarsis TaxID=2605962 RepID=UPI0040356D08
MDFNVLCVLVYVLWRNLAMADETIDDIRPYEFSFNIENFQHRFEKKDVEGIITGEFGFITADGVYHETGYATDKNGDFIITRMRNRKITNLKDALEIFKDRPETAKKLVEAVARACSSCKIPVKQGEAITKSKLAQERNRIPENSKDLLSDRRGKSLIDAMMNTINGAKKFLNTTGADPNFLEKMANDLYYRFNYTITSHGHQEDGYRDGKKDGSYRAQSENGVDTRVKYLSNEFGHQPNVSFVPSPNGTTERQRLKGYSFLWNWS